MKRGRKDSLTGGSGDVNPQTMVVTLTQSAADTATVFAQQLPIPRLPTKPGKNLVIEALGVTYYNGNPFVVAANTERRLTASVTTRPNAPANLLDQLQDPRKVSLWTIGLSTPAGATLTATPGQLQFYDDLTDNAGHGILIATDVLYFVVTSATTGIANQLVFDLEYRFKEVDLVEYIGIVQSQQ